MKNILLFKNAKLFSLLSFVLLFLLFSGKSYSQTAIANTTAVTQNFDGMAASLSLPTNWRMAASTSTPTWTGASTSVTQQASSNMPTPGGTYNFGSSASERAVGAMTSGSFDSPNNLLGFFQNTNASNLTSLTISYDAERYRINSAAASVQFYYSVDGTSWIAVTAGNIAAASFPTGTNTYNFTTGTVINRTGVSITGLNIATNGAIYLRWNINTVGANSQGIAIDNFSLTAGYAAAAVSPIFNTFSDVTKTYGDANFSMTASSTNSSGAITYTSSNTSVATINNTSGVVTIKGAGNTIITANIAAVTGFTAGSTSATLTVGKANGLSITATGVSKTFGGILLNGTSSGFSVTGLQYTDGLGTGATVNLTYGTGAAALDSATLSGVSPAVYTGSVTPSSVTNGSAATYSTNNYNNPSFSSGNITVSKANQSITFAASATKFYGDANYDPGATSTTSGINTIIYSTNGTTVATVVSNNVSIIGVGSAVITASQAGDDNYISTFTNQSLTVSPKNLSITGISIDNKNYDENTSATINSSSTPILVGVVGADDVSLTGAGTATFISSAVGTGIQVNVLGFSLNGTAIANYSLTQPILFADIIANTPTIFTSGSLSALSATYGTESTTTTFTVSAQSLTEGVLIVAPAGFELSSNGGTTYGSSTTVGSTGNLASTLILVRLAATNAVGTYSGNINLTSLDATSFTVATVLSPVLPKGLTIVGLIGNNRSYDGTTTATVGGIATLVGVVGSDDVTLNSNSVTYNFATATAGVNKPITVLGYTLNGTSAGNYTVTQPSLTATIDKAASTIVVTGTFSFTFNGTAQGPNTSTVTGSTGAVTYSYTGVNPIVAPSASRPTNVGDYTVAATVATDTNYLAATSADFSFSVSKADQTIILVATDTRTTASAPYTLVLNASSGLAIAYTSSNNLVATISGNTVTITGVGVAVISASQAGNTNYNAATNATQSLTVTLPACAAVSGTTSYNFGTASPFTASPTTTQPNVSLSALSQGNSFGSLPSVFLSLTSTSSGYTGASGTGNAGIAAVNGTFSTTSSAFFTFTVTPAVGYNFTLNGITFGSRSTNTGPLAYSLRSSLDNFATDIATGTFVNNSAYALKSNTGLSVTGNGNANPVTFRIYGYGATITAGINTVNWRIDDLALTLATSNAPSAASVGIAQSICGLTSTSLGGNTPGVGTGTWSQVSGSGTSTFSEITTGSSTATASALGAYVYRWSISNGCATTYTANITVDYKTPTTASITADGVTSFCEGGSVGLTANPGVSYLWSTGATTQSISATTTGNYTVAVTAENGCSATSTATPVTVTPNTSNTTTVSVCDTYTWSINGQTYTAGGTYTSVLGCNTEILLLTITPSTTSPDVTVSVCDIYTWSFNGQSYTVSGVYTSTVNCNTTTLHLTITPSATNTTSAAACDTYTWSVNGQTYTATGTYTGTTVNCVTQVLNLTITPSSNNVTTISACDTYVWLNNNQTYTASGTYTGTTANCVTQVLNLTITPSSNNVTTIAACDSYVWANNNQTYTTSGIYTGNTVNCITEVLNVTITPSVTNTTYVTACDSYMWPVDGNTYTDSDEFSATVGCVTETLVLTINNSTSSPEAVTACDTYFWSANGATYTASGTYTNVTTNASGCPNTATLVLTINNSTTSTISATACDSYTWSANGATYTASGTYTNVTTNAAGCPNTATLVLTINNSTTSTISATACDSYTWSANGVTYTSSTTATYVSGCNTTTLNLTINTSTITLQPVATNICTTVGSTASISVASTTVSPTYVWQFRVVTALITNPSWITITSANAGAVYSNFTTATLGIARATTALPAIGTQYRVTVAGGACGSVISDTANLTILGVVKPGTIANAASVCTGGDITFTLGAYVGTSVQWQSSFGPGTVAAPAIWSNITGATAFSYTATSVTAASNKSYRAIVTNGPCGNTTATTATKTIIVNPLSVAGTITGGGAVCALGSGTLTLTGHVGTVQWEYSTDGTTYFNAPKASVGQLVPFSTTSVSSIGTSYVVTAISQDLHFRARVTSGACLVLYATPVQFTIGTLASVGTASAAATAPICKGTGTTLSLTGVNTGVITWQKRLATATLFTNILNSNVTSIATGNLASTTVFRASVTIGSCSTVLSNDVTVLIVAEPLAKALTSNVTTPTGATTSRLCTSFNVAKTLTVGAGYVGTIQWQHSTLTNTTGFVAIPAATSPSYTINVATAGVANYYRAVFTNSCGAFVNGTAVTLWYTSCSAKAAAPAVLVTAPFSVIAYPNPYTETFNLSVTTLSEERVGVMVYDMTGRLIEQREVTASDVSGLQVGDRYPSGVYNVVVTQGAEVKTLRVIKR